MGIKSIWDNSFYKNYTPLPKWAFEVNFCNLVSSKSGINPELLNKAVTNAVWGKKEAGAIVPIYYAGIMVNHPGRINTAGELSITFNENSKLSITQLLEKVFSLYTFNETFFNETVNGTAAKYKKEETWKGNNIEVILHSMSKAGNKEIEGESRSKKYVFHNCFATNLEEVEDSYDSDEIVQRTMRFSYDYMTSEKA